MRIYKGFGLKEKKKFAKVKTTVKRKRQVPAEQKKQVKRRKR